MARFCANCGTEVDESAVFCPTCGQAIDQAAEVAIPPAPSWPERVPDDEPDDLVAEPAGSDVAPSWVAADPTEPVGVPPSDEPAWIDEAPRADEDHGPLPPQPPSSVTGSRASTRAGGTSINVPVTWPVTLSAWLIGVG